MSGSRFGRRDDGAGLGEEAEALLASIEDGRESQDEVS
jgi:hypothetical protein